MKKTINVDRYLQLKEKNILTVFIFVLDDEYLHLEYETSWLYYFGMPIYLVRMNEDEFHMMDIAIHPKIIITKKGKELLEINGIPKVEEIKEQIKTIRF